MHFYNSVRFVCNPRNLGGSGVRLPGAKFDKYETSDYYVECDVSYLVSPDDLAKVDLELIEGNKPGSKWLVIEKTYICHVNAGSTEGDVTYWECRRRRHDRYFI